KAHALADGTGGAGNRKAGRSTQVPSITRPATRHRKARHGTIGGRGAEAARGNAARVQWLAPENVLLHPPVGEHRPFSVTARARRPNRRPAMDGAARPEVWSDRAKPAIPPV